MCAWKIVNPQQSKWRVVEPKKEEPQGWGAVGNDVLSMLLKAPGALMENAERIPGEMMGIHAQMNQDPVRLLQSGVGGIAKGVHETANLPASLAGYLSEKGIVPEGPISDWIKGARIPEPSRLYPEILGRRGQQSGDWLAESIGEASPGLVGQAPIKGMMSLGAKAVASPVKGAGNVARSFSPERIAKKVLRNTENAEMKSTHLYENKFHKPAEAAGIKVDYPKLEKGLVKDLIIDAPKEYQELIGKWMKDRNIRNSHELYKETSRKASELQRESRKRSLTGKEKDSLAAALKTKDFIETNMISSLEKAGRGDLVEALKEANKHFQQKVIPHRHPAILKHQDNLRTAARSEGMGKSGLSTKKMIKELESDAKFEAGLGNLYPELGIRRKFPMYMGAGTLATGGYLGKKLLEDR